MKKVENIVKSKIRIANSNEVLKLTNHPVGGVPPVGTGIRTFVDKGVMEHDFVYLVEISGAEVCDVAEREER